MGHWRGRVRASARRQGRSPLMNRRRRSRRRGPTAGRGAATAASCSSNQARSMPALTHMRSMPVRGVSRAGNSGTLRRALIRRSWQAVAMIRSGRCSRAMAKAMWLRKATRARTPWRSQMRAMPPSWQSLQSMQQREVRLHVGAAAALLHAAGQDQQDRRRRGAAQVAADPAVLGPHQSFDEALLPARHRAQHPARRGHQRHVGAGLPGGAVGHPRPSRSQRRLSSKASRPKLTATLSESLAPAMGISTTVSARASTPGPTPSTSWPTTKQRGNA